MNKEKRRVPKLRFPGFTEDWEQRKLCQITTRVTRKNGGLSDLPLTISAQDGLVDQRKYFNRQVASRDMSNYYLIKKGEFAYNKSYSEGYPFGAVKRLDYYDIGALSTLYILFEITDNNISSDFIVSYYMTHLWYKEISKRAAEGARNHGLLNISTEDFFDSELNIPNSIEEQVKIGNFIKQLDKFITLHQRKLEHLNLKKKALLQKLFPKNGERYPELRFPGFTDAWEQRKVNEIFKVTRGQVLAASLTTPEKNRGNVYPVFSSQTKDNGLLGYYSEYLFENAITWTTDGANAGTVNFRPGRFYSTNVNGVLINENGYACYAVSEIINKVAYKYVSKVGNPKLMNNVMAEINIMITPDIDELKQISKLIEAYNQYITLHQRKLDHLQLQKKALLQQMFV
ncbi:restriction endonuclease subunit S [Veillonella tobetsuensis]|uniref:restriction endonuclease subunit S n=1 Tax=Veillonella tobetsuensis TaxID=1110546 RepID=UPI0007508B26|nr:restriction endonuclease subunit S [Veillonella tobetsuensis]